MSEQRLRFVLPGPPIAWHRAEPTKWGGRRQHPADKQFQAAIGRAATVAIAHWKRENQCKWSLEGEWELEVMAHVGDRLRRDASNILKNVEDGLSKVAFKDDAQVVDTRCIKLLSRKNPRTIVNLRRVEGYLVDEAQGVLGLR